MLQYNLERFYDLLTIFIAGKIGAITVRDLIVL